MDVRVKRGAELATDHHLVVCTLRLASLNLARKTKLKRMVRIRWEALADEDNRRSFTKKIDEKFSQIPSHEADVESEWLLFRTAIVGAAMESCGVKRVGPPAGQKRTAWWTDEVRVVINEKKTAYRTWIGQQTAENRRRYMHARDKAKETVAKAKSISWENFGHRLESDYHSAGKVFWQTIRRLRKSGCTTTRSMKDAAGRLLTSDDEILNRWKEYFDDLYNPSSGRRGTTAKPQSVGVSDISLVEVMAAVRALKSGKAAGVDEIRPEMLKSLSNYGLHWLTRICSVAWKSGKAPEDWQTGVVVPIFKKGDQRDCSNYRGITLLSLPGKVYARVLERRCRQIVESKIQDSQCGFRAGRGTTDQLFTLRQVYEKAWEFGQSVYTSFIDLEKAYDRVPRDLLWSVLREYGIDGQLLAAIQSLYDDCKSCVRINGHKSAWFWVRVGLRQGCVLSPLLFIIFMDRISRRSTTQDCIKVGDVKVESLLFADDIARLASTAAGLQQAMDRFAAECSASGMQISVKKTEIMVVSRQPEQCALYTNGKTLNQVEKFKYLGVEFSSDGKQDGEIDRRIGAASGVLRSLYRSVVTKAEISLKTKLAIFKSVYRPTLIYGHEQWVMSERVRSRIQAAEMRFLRRAAGLTLRDRIRSSDIRESLRIEPLLLHIERSQLRWFGHVMRMSHDRLAYQVFQSKPSGKRPVGRPRMSWKKYIERLCDERLQLPNVDAIAAAKDRNQWKKLLNELKSRPERIRERK